MSADFSSSDRVVFEEQRCRQLSTAVNLCIKYTLLNLCCKKTAYPIGEKTANPCNCCRFHVINKKRYILSVSCALSYMLLLFLFLVPVDNVRLFARILACMTARVTSSCHFYKPAMMHFFFLHTYRSSYCTSRFLGESSYFFMFNNLN